MWNRFSLKIQLIIFMTSVIAIIEIATLVVVFNINKAQVKESSIKNINVIVSSFNNDLVKMLLNPNADIFSDISFRLSAFTNIKSILLYNNKGKAVFQYGNISLLQKNREALKNRRYIFAKTDLLIKEDIVSQGYEFGYVLVDTDLKEYNIKYQSLLYMLFLTFLIILIIGIILSVILSKKFIKPIEQLLYGIKNSNPAKDEIIKLNTDAKNEIKELFDAFNHQMKDINIATKEIKKTHQIMQAQSRLAQMGEMISMIAHQWRQPLTAISSRANAMIIKSKLNKITNELVIANSKYIVDYSSHLSSTIDDFRDFFKANKKKTITSFDKIIKEVLSIVEISIANKNIQIIKELNCSEEFHSFENELKQVVLNLIKNAEDILLEKNVENPYIKVKTYIKDTKYILEVVDNGGGIPIDIIDNIFDPYFSTKLQKDGTGLGLYMSKTIIEEHCYGKLLAFNNNHGAVFKVELNR